MSHRPKPPFATSRRLLPLVLRAALIALPAAAFAPLPLHAQAAPASHRFDVPAGPLSTVLTQLAAQAGVRLTANAELTANRNAPALAGTMTLQQALDRLLAGSGLRASVEGSGIVVREMEATLKAVKVRGEFLGGTTEGTGSYAPGPSKSATGLELTLRETPQSVSVITQQRIEDQALVSLTEALRITPGISVKMQDRGRSEYASRGFRVANFQLDGIPMISGGVIDSESISTVIYDRIEAVRGANGLMSGAGRPGASINMVRKHADSKTFTGRISLEGGSWNRYGGMVDLSAPLSEDGSVRGRAVASYRDQEGFVDFEDKETIVFYAALDADLGSATRLSFAFSDQHDNRNGTYWGGLPIWYADGTRTDWSRSKTTAAKWHQWDDHTQNIFATLEHHFDGGWSVKAGAQHTRGEEMNNLLWWSGRPDRETGLGMSATPYYYLGEPKQNLFNVQASGPFDLLGRTHEMTVGAIYSRANYGWKVRDQIDTPAPVDDFNHWDGNHPEPVWGDLLVGNSKQREKQTAAYTAVRLNPADPLKIIAGARVTRYDYNAAPAYGSPAREWRESGVFTPYLGVLYDLNDWLTTYASYTSIFEPNKYRDRTGAMLDPVEGNSFEAGLKGEFLEGALTASAALFRTEQDNFAVRDGDEYVPGTTDRAYRAEKGIESEGYELELVGQLNPRWDVSVSWTQFLARNQQGVRVDTRFPTRMFKLFTKYELAGALSGLSVGGGVDWQNDMPDVRANPVTGASEDVGQSAYVLANLMARYQISKPLAVQLNVYNALDKEYYESSWGTFTWGEPRRVLMSLDYRF